MPCIILMSGLLFGYELLVIGETEMFNARLFDFNIIGKNAKYLLVNNIKK